MTDHSDGEITGWKRNTMDEDEEIKCLKCEESVSNCECDKYCTVCHEETGDTNFCINDFEFYDCECCNGEDE